MKLRDRLKLSVVKFSYLKKNGEKRYATGTNNLELLSIVFGMDIKTLKEGRDRCGITTYFDVEKKGWRSLVDENLLEIIND
tara:strand:+ start:932 stop:1174 length:243 start_codon:yes stop_codon:yes gene_type:complete